jgi:uncharacterized protein involved in exopolysaccharide biosynthesis
METVYQTDQPQKIADDFSPKKFILQVKSMCSYLLSKWLWILLFATLLGIGGIIYVSTKNTVFTSEITFALDEEATQKAQNGFVELGEELGLGPSTVDASGALFGRMTNIVELMQSRLLIEKTLRDTIMLNGKNLIFADLFLDSLDGYRSDWMLEAPYDHLVFNSKKDSLAQNKILRMIHETLLGKYIKVDRKGKETTIISVSCNTENEAFSKYFLESLVREVTNYYTDIKTQRAKTNLTFIEKRMDSIRPAYNSSLYGRAVFMDAHTNAIRQISTVPSEKQATDVQILKAAYVELSRSQEAAKIALVRVTPLIQYLDMPILPLKQSNTSSIKFFMIFFIIGAFFTTVFFFIRRVIKNIMGDEEPEVIETYYSV